MITPRYRCNVVWGRRGLAEAASRGDIIVVVDVLSFSTVVATAVQRGAVVIPCGLDDDAAAIARSHNAQLAVHRNDAPHRGAYSLSPTSFLSITPDERVVLPSPNGGACSRLGTGASYLFAGALVNATAVGNAVTSLAETTDVAISIIAAGERFETPSDDGTIRFAVEDYLGAGAILAATAADKSPEADVCESAFTQMRHRVGEILWGCESGRELRERGSTADVQHASQLDLYGSVPFLHRGRFERWEQPLAKALAYVTRTRGDRRELLVFEHVDHPEAGVQVPAGTIEDGETPEQSVIREVYEETGLASVRLVRLLTMHTMYAEWQDAYHLRHIYHLECDDDVPDAWTHVVTAGRDDVDLRFACRWMSLDDEIALAGGQGAYLEYLL